MGVMKRGLFGLIALVLILSLPGVLAAKTFLDLIFGTSDESILFLKIAYAMLVFIIFVKVTKESVFTKEQEKLANMFSLLLAFFTLRFTPDSWIENFGWVIMAIAPFIIFYKLSGVFVKEEKDKFSWIRFFLALIATLFLLFALGSTDAFGVGLGSTPYVGGFFDEFFSDVNYFFFSSLSPLWSLFFIGLLIGGLFLLFSRFRGGAGAGGAGFGGSWLWGLLLVLGIAAFLGLLGSLLGGVLSFGLGPLAGLLSVLSWLGIVALFILLLYLLYKFPVLRQVLGRIARFIFWDLWGYIFGGIGYALRVIWGWIRGLFGRGGGAPGPGRGNGGLVLNLQAGAQNVGNLAVAGAPIVVAPGSVTPFVLTAYRRRRLLRNVPLAGANFTIIRVNNGIIAPATGTSDAFGVLRVVYTAPNVAGNSQLHIELTHAEINPATVIPDRAINIGAMGALNVINPAPAPGTAIDVGNFVDIVVEVDDGVNGINGANVEIIFPRTPGLGPLRGTTAGGSPGLIAIPATPARRSWYGRRIPATPGAPAAVGRPGVVTIRTPAFTAAGTYNFEIAVTAAGFANPAPVPGAILVNNPRRENLEIFNHSGRVGGTVITGTPLVPVRIGQNVDIELFVRVPVVGAVAARMIDTATITITPAVGVSTPIRRGAGRYMGLFRPTAAQIGTQRFVIQASLAGYNDAIEYLDIEVEDLPQLNVGITQPISPMRQGATENVVVTVTRAGSTVPVDAQVTATVNRTLFANRRTGATGILSIAFTPATPGNYTFEIEVRAVGYQNPPNQNFNIIVLAPLPLRTIVVVQDAAGNPLTRPLRSGEDARINVLVEDNTGAPLVGAAISVTPNTNLSGAIGRLNASGEFRTDFRAPAVTTPTPFVYRINLTIPAGYILTTPIAPVTINVEPPQMRMTITPSATEVRIGDSINIDFVAVDDRTGSPIPGVNFTVTNLAGGRLPTGFFPPLFVAGPPAVIRSAFAPTAAVTPGDYQFDVIASTTRGGYAPVNGNFNIRVTSQKHMRVTVNWVPEPANKYMLMNFVVFDSVSGNNINGAVIGIRDVHPYPVNIIGTVYTTNNTGQLPTELRIDLGGGRVAGKAGETHRLNITVICPPYLQRTGSLDINFSHPRTPMGTPQSRLL